MSFDEECFDENSFWATLIEKIKIALSPLRKAIKIRLHKTKTMTLDLAPEAVKKNIQISLRMRKHMKIKLGKVE